VEQQPKNNEEFPWLAVAILSLITFGLAYAVVQGAKNMQAPILRLGRYS